MRQPSVIVVGSLNHDIMVAAPDRPRKGETVMGERWWPIFGAVYFLVAVKRVRGIKLIGPLWKAPRKRVTAPVAVANRRPTYQEYQEEHL